MNKVIRLFLCSLMLLAVVFNAQAKLSETIKFSGKPIKSKEHPGLVFKLSKPYLRYQKCSIA